MDKGVVVVCANSGHGGLVKENVQNLVGDEDVVVAYKHLPSLYGRFVFDRRSVWQWLKRKSRTRAACVLVCVPMADQVVILPDQTNEHHYANVLKQARKHSHSMVIAVVDTNLEQGEDWNQDMEDLVVGQPKLKPFQDAQSLWLVGRSFTARQCEMLRRMLALPPEEEADDDGTGSQQQQE